jgi:nucleoside-diphosphate-sugar epimerase
VLQNPAAAGTWMVSDGEDLSTAELVRLIARKMGRRVRLVAVPVPVLRLLGALTGRSAEVSRLCGSLTIDISRTRSALGWTPSLTVEAALGRTVDWYLSTSGPA